MSKTLFQPAHKRQRHLTVLLRGFSGSGKTKAALGFPGPIAVVDLENSTSLYDGFDVLATRDLRELDQALTVLARSDYQTVVIDSLTVVWQLLQQAMQEVVDRRGRKFGNGDSLESGQVPTDREWGIIKRWLANFLTRLINLPMHVVLIARETDQYTKDAKGQLALVGTKADVEKNTVYNVALELILSTVRTEQGTLYQATVGKTRLAEYGLTEGLLLTKYGPTPAEGLYARHLARVAAALSANRDADRPLDEESAVLPGNAQVLAESENPPPNERAALKRRMVAALSRPALQLRSDEDKAKVVQAITGGKKSDALDLDGYKVLVERCEALRTEDDLLRFWAAHDQAQAAKQAAS